MIWLLLILLCVPIQTWAAVVCSNVTAANSATPTDPLTIAYTTPAGSNQVLFVLSGIRHTTVTINSATHANNAMTPVAAASTLSPVAVRGFYIVNPTAGTNNVVVDYSATPLADAAIVVTCSGVNTASPIHDPTSASNTGTAVSNTVPNVVSGDVVLDFFVQDLLTTTPTEGANQTVLNKGNDTSELGWGGSQQAGSDGGVMSWTTALSEQWASQAFAVVAASAATRRMIAPQVIP
jgi:hypothetical protein